MWGIINRKKGADDDFDVFFRKDCFVIKNINTLINIKDYTLNKSESSTGL